MESAHDDIGTREVLESDESFFTALLAADHELLGTILADDFLIIDVLSGQVAHRQELLGDVAVIIAQPGSKSQRNAQRQGFGLLYTRAVLIKQP